jgi:hypothetical protein
LSDLNHDVLKKGLVLMNLPRMMKAKKMKNSNEKLNVKKKLVEVQFCYCLHESENDCFVIGWIEVNMVLEKKSFELLVES